MTSIFYGTYRLFKQIDITVNLRAAFASPFIRSVQISEASKIRYNRLRNNFFLCSTRNLIQYMYKRIRTEVEIKLTLLLL